MTKKKLTTGETAKPTKGAKHGQESAKSSRTDKNPASKKSANPKARTSRRRKSEADSGELVNVRRRQDRSVKTREKILEAALVEFAALGFEGATTRSIAERAKVPHGLLIYHFDTKLGVWQAVMERAFSELHDRFTQTMESLAGADPAVALRAAYRDFIETSAARPELGWLFSHEVSGTTERIHWLLSQARGRDMEYTLGLIRQLQAEGRYVEGDPAHLHFLFVGAASRIFGFAPEVRHHLGVSPFDPTFVRSHVELCEKLFFRD